MKSKKSSCTSCKECCKFYEEHLYFAPTFTKEEIASVKGIDKKLFKPFKRSKNVFQIKLAKSKENKKLYVCPLLDEKKHLCSIYGKRPIDCRMWPFMFVKDKKNQVFLACFEKDACPIMDKMDEKSFKAMISSATAKMKKDKVAKIIKEHPAIIWDYEDDTFLVCRLEDLEN